MLSVLTVIGQLDRVTSPAELGKRLLNLTSSFGVEYILAGVLPDGAPSAESVNGSNLSGWSRELQREALREDLVPGLSIDPDKRITHHFFRALPSGEVTHVPRNGSAGGAPKAIDHMQALTFPIVTIGGRTYGFRFLGQELHQDSRVIEALRFIANYAFARMLKVDPASRPKLTERQCSTLQWAAEGKTDKEIAAILSISEHTVDKHMRRCKEALSAVNRTAAIVLAMRYGLIS